MNRWILISEIRAVESVLKSRQRGFVFFSKPNCLWILIGLRRAEGEWGDKVGSLYAAVALQARSVFNTFLTMPFASVRACAKVGEQNFPCGGIRSLSLGMNDDLLQRVNSCIARQTTEL